MIENLNIELRSKILEYSLFIEMLINDLLLLNLGVYEKEKTKLFSNKGRISFQNKIDLLFDLNILSKEENLEFELLMIIRNKFIHDIECKSFNILLNQLDKGIVNRFKKYLKEGELITNEEACKTASYKVFKKNIETIKKKIQLNKSSTEKKLEFFKAQNKRQIYYTDFIYNLLEEISIVTENSELKNPKVAVLGEKILQIIEKSVNKLNVQSEIIKKQNEEFFNSDENIKSIFGLKKLEKDLPKWENFKLAKK